MQCRRAPSTSSSLLGPLLTFWWWVVCLQQAAALRPACHAGAADGRDQQPAQEVQERGGGQCHLLDHLLRAGAAHLHHDVLLCLGPREPTRLAAPG